MVPGDAPRGALKHWQKKYCKKRSLGILENVNKITRSTDFVIHCILWLDNPKREMSF